MSATENKAPMTNNQTTSIDRNHPSRTEAAAVANIVTRLQKPHTLGLKEPEGEIDASVLLVPEGFKAESIRKYLDEYLDEPRRREGTAVLQSLASFIAHAKRFKGIDSAIFADRANEKAPTLTSVLDYHEPGAHGRPRFGTHRGHYAFPLSDEWKEWKAQDARPFESQTAFAEFIENRLADICPPSGAGPAAEEFQQTMGCDFATAVRLLELSRGLEVRVASRIKQAQRLESGETQLIYEESHHDSVGGQLKIPGAFIIQIPVFRGGPRYQLPVRLRYRMTGTSVSWFYEIYRDDVTFDHAFTEACDDARRETELPLFEGKPEA